LEHTINIGGLGNEKDRKVGDSSQAEREAMCASSGAGVEKKNKKGEGGTKEKRERGPEIPDRGNSSRNTRTWSLEEFSKREKHKNNQPTFLKKKSNC